MSVPNLPPYLIDAIIRGNHLRSALTNATLSWLTATASDDRIGATLQSASPKPFPELILVPAPSLAHIAAAEQICVLESHAPAHEFVSAYLGVVQLSNLLFLVHENPCSRMTLPCLLEIVVGTNTHQSGLGFTLSGLLVQERTGATQPIKLGHEYGDSITCEGMPSTLRRFFTPANGEFNRTAVRKVIDAISRILQDASTVPVPAVLDGSKMSIVYDAGSSDVTVMITVLGALPDDSNHSNSHSRRLEDGVFAPGLTQLLEMLRKIEEQ
eukprot:c16722_g1_i1.p1 GENE.c16722_g1_i1~~c16722_g1_i1.p1  ORF type:complete len:269 (+),score=57.62 c16722_g1_i1:656-1462(+)